MPLEDIEIITAIFAGVVIREGFGKFSAHSFRHPFSSYLIIIGLIGLNF
jgi:hypothetical protein